MTFFHISLLKALFRPSTIIFDELRKRSSLIRERTKKTMKTNDFISKQKKTPQNDGISSPRYGGEEVIAPCYRKVRFIAAASSTSTLHTLERWAANTMRYAAARTLPYTRARWWEPSTKTGIRNDWVFASLVFILYSILFVYESIGGTLSLRYLAWSERFPQWKMCCGQNKY